jgi:hypothetical protein
MRFTQQTAECLALDPAQRPGHMHREPNQIVTQQTSSGVSGRVSKGDQGQPPLDAQLGDLLVLC